MLVPVLLTGGSGTRLWPLSRKSHPKQFLRLAGDASLLEATAVRLRALPGAAPAVAVAGEAHRFIVAEHLRRAGENAPQILLEPEGRNTAPAIALAALSARAAHGEDAVLFVSPSDHLVADRAGFAAAAARAVAAAADGRLVTFGVRPAWAETGYGYIRAGAAQGEGVFALDAFVEKPDAATARAYLDDGGYYWNSGMFVFTAGAYLAALERHAGDILEACVAAMEGAAADGDFVRIGADAFLGCRAESIDYAIMEHTDNAALVPLDSGWNDVGSWRFLAETTTPDADGNAQHGDVWLRDSRNCTVYARDRLVAALGLDDTVVVETKDAVLVAAADRMQDVRKIVAELDAAGRGEVDLHPRVYRPWGAYESVDGGERFQVKRIIVNPGAKLSLQMHHHRAEHWTVVRGTARVTRGDDTFMLSEDQSTYIPIGTRHRLENPGAIPLELIEVQTGSYLGEDDIVRYDDDYGREGD